MQKKPLRITRAQAGLVVVDIQERLLPLIFEKERLVQNTVLLIKGAAILRLPVFATEQYRKGLGVERMREAGAVIVSTEMALFELLERAATEEFKQILALVR